MLESFHCVLVPTKYIFLFYSRNFMQNYSLLFPHCPSTCKTGGLNSIGDVRMGIITKAKKSCTAFEKPGPRRHMALSCIAMGLLQSLSIYSIGKISSDQIRYQRTPSQGRVSEARMMHNANNSWTTGRVRRTLGFSGFLVVQTFNCQVIFILHKKQQHDLFHSINHAAFLTLFMIIITE